MEIENEGKDHTDKNQVPDSEIRFLREKAIYDLFEKGFKAEKIAEFFNMTKRQVWNLHYRIERPKDPKKEQRPKRFVVINEMLEDLETFMSTGLNKLTTLSTIRNHIVEKFHLEERGLALSTVSSMLKRMKYRRKRVQPLPPQRNMAITLLNRKNVAMKFISALIEDKEFIFIDETGFNVAMKPLYGYSKVGEPCKAPSISKGENLTVIAAITKSEVIGYQILKGGVTAEDFGGFMVGLLHNNRYIIEERSKYIIFLDNAPIHIAKILRPCFERLNVFFNAPYSPFLNPIEEFFGICKANFRKKFSLNTIGVEQKIHQSICEVDPAVFYSYYIHSLSHLRDCLQENPIV